MRISYLITFLLLLSSGLKAQYNIADLDLDKDLSVWYDRENSPTNHELLEGAFVSIQTRSPLSHQFFEENQWAVGSITYNGTEFDNIYLLYDIADDLLFVRNVNISNAANQSILINQALIDDFEIHGSKFENFRDTGIDEVSPGLYQIIEKGTSASMVAKRLKTTKVVDDGFDRGIFYYVKSQYFLITNDNFVKFKNKGTFFKAFPNYKNDIKVFIKNEGLSIKKDSDSDLSTLVHYCNTLIK